MTRAAIETRILSLYTAGCEAEAFNISELARGTGAAYPHVHAAVNGMIAQGILRGHAVGKSLCCTVNLKDALARNLLGQAAVRRKEGSLDRPNLRNMDGQILRLAVEEPRLLSVILSKERLLFVVTDRSAIRPLLARTDLINIVFSTPDELREQLLATLAPIEGTVLHGYDRLLLMLIPIQERLLLNHSRFFRPLPRSLRASASSHPSSRPSSHPLSHPSAHPSTDASTKAQRKRNGRRKVGA